MKFSRNVFLILLLIGVVIVLSIIYATNPKQLTPSTIVINKLSELDTLFKYSSDLTLAEKSVYVFTPNGGGTGFSEGCVRGNIVYVFNGDVDIRNLPDHITKVDVDDIGDYENMLHNRDLFKRMKMQENASRYSIFILKYGYPNYNCW